MQDFTVTYYDAIQDDKMWTSISANTSSEAVAKFESMYGTSKVIVRVR